MAKQLNVSLAMTADTSQAKAQLQDLQKQLTNLVNTGGNKSNFALTKEIQQATQAAAQLKASLTAATDVKTGKLDLGVFDQQLKKSNKSLNEYRDAFKNLGPAGDKAFASLATSIMGADAKIIKANGVLKEFATTLANTARWQLSSSVLHGFMGAIQGALGYAKDLNESLTNIQIVTGQSSEQMARFAEQANKSAQALSTTTTAYTDAALIFYQQGLKDSDVKARTDAVIKMAQATGDSAKEVSSYMTAIWNNFAEGSDNLEHFADVITALGASTASSSSEIASGLQQFAAIGETVGLSYDYATSALATLVANTRQSADQIGNSLKTIFSRLQGLKQGDATEDGVDLNKYSKALQNVGVEIIDTNGEMKEMDRILDELAGKWDTLNKKQQMALAQTVGGTRQYTQLISLMNNWGDMEKNLQTAANADGTLQNQADIYAESWEASSKRVKAAAQEIYQSLLDDKFFISFNNSFAKFLNTIDLAIKGLGGVKGILLLLGNIVTQVFQREIATSLENAGAKISSLKTGVENTVLKLRGKDTKKDPAEARREEAAKSLINMKVDEGTFSGAAQSKAYEAQGQAALELQKHAKDLSEQEKITAQILMDQNKFRSEAVIQSAEQAKEAKKQADEERRELEIKNKSLRDGKIGSKWLKGSESVSQKNGRINAIDKALFSAGGKDLFNNKVDINTDLGKEKINELKASLETLETGIKETGLTLEDSLGKNASLAFNELKNSLTFDNNGKFVGDIQQVENAWKNWTNTVENSNNGIELAKNKLIELVSGLSKTEIAAVQNGTATQAMVQKYDSAKSAVDNFINSNQQVGTAEIDTAGKTGILMISLETLKEKFQQAATQQMSFSQALTKTSSVIMGVGTILTSFKGIMDIINDSSKTVGEKIAGIAMSFGMLIPSVVSIVSILPSLSTQVTIFGTATKFAFGEILLFIGAIALAGAAIYSLYKIFRTPSPEENLKKAKEEARSLADAADEAKNKAQELHDAFDNYDSVVEKLKQCTKGTQDWRDAIEDVNTQVLEMLKNYPELAPYVKRNADGLLQFKEGYEDIIAQADAASQSANMASIQKNAENLKQESENNINKTLADNNINSEAQKFIKDNINDIAGMTFDEFTKKAEKSGLQISDFGDNIEQLFPTLQQLSESSITATEGLKNVGQIAANNLDPDKYSEEARTMVGNNYENIVDDKRNEVLGEIGQWARVGVNRGDADLDALWEEYQKAGGHQGDLADNSLQGWDAEKGRIEQFAYRGDGDTEDKYVSAEEVADTVAAYRAMKELGTSAEDAGKALNHLKETEDNKNIVSGLQGFATSGNLEKLNQRGLDELKEDRDAAGGTEEYLKKQFGVDDLSSIGIDPKVFDKALEDADTALDSFSNDISQLVQDAFTNLTNTRDLSVGGKEAIVNLLNNTYEQFGKDGLTAMQASLEKMSSEDLGAFGDIIADMDWNSATLEDFKSKLEEAGLDTTNAAKNFENLKRVLGGLSSVTEDTIKSLQDSYTKIKDMKTGDTLSEDDYNKLDESVKSAFQDMGDGTYMLVQNADVLKERTKEALDIQRLSQVQNSNREAEKYDHMRQAAAFAENGGGTYGKDASSIIGGQLDILKTANLEDLGISQEDLDGWIEKYQMAMKNGSDLGRVFGEDLSKIKDLTQEVGISSEDLAKKEEEATQRAIDQQSILLASQENSRDFMDSIQSIQENGVDIHGEALANGAMALAARYENCTEEANRLQQAQNELAEAMEKGEQKAIDAANAEVQKAVIDVVLSAQQSELAQAYGVTEDYVESLQEKYLELDETMADEGDVVLQLTEAAVAQNKSWEDLKKGIEGVKKGSESYLDVLKKLDDATMDEVLSNQEYAETYSKNNKLVAKTLGVSEDTVKNLNKEKKNRDLLTDAINGNEKALAKYHKAAAKEQFKNSGASKNMRENLEKNLQKKDVDKQKKDIDDDKGLRVNEKRSLKEQVKSKITIDDKDAQKALDNVWDKLSELEDGADIHMALEGDEEARAAFEAMTQSIADTSTSMDDLRQNLAAQGIFGDIVRVAQEDVGKFQEAGYEMVSAAGATTDRLAQNMEISTDVEAQNTTFTANDTQETPSDIIADVDTKPASFPIATPNISTKDFTIPNGSGTSTTKIGQLTGWSTSSQSVNFPSVTFSSGDGDTTENTKENTATALMIKPRKGGGGGGVSSSNRSAPAGSGGGGRRGGGGRGRRRAAARREARRATVAVRTDTSHAARKNIETNLGAQSKAYERLAKATDAAFGNAKLKNMDAEIKKQKDIIAKTNELTAATKKLVLAERNRLSNKDSKMTGLQYKMLDKDNNETVVTAGQKIKKKDKKGKTYYDDISVSISTGKKVVKKDKKGKVVKDKKGNKVYVDEQKSVKLKQRSIKDILGSNLDFAEDGTLLNEDKIEKVLQDRINTAQNAIDRAKTDKQKADAQTYMNFITAENERIKQELESYKEDLEAYWEEIGELADKQLELRSKELERIDYKLNLQVEVNDEDIERIESKLNHLGKINIVLDDEGAVVKDTDKAKGQMLDLYKNKQTDIENKMTATRTAAKELLAKRGISEDQAEEFLKTGKIDNKDGGAWRTNLSTEDMDALAGYRSSLISLRDEYEEIGDTIFTLVNESMSSWLDALDQQSARIENAGATLDHFKNVIDIVGKDFIKNNTVLGDGKVLDYGKLLQSQVDQKQALANSRKSAYEIAKASYDENKKVYEEIYKKGNAEQISQAAAAMKEAEEEMLSRQQEWQSAVEDALQAAKDAFTSTMEDYTNSILGPLELIEQQKELADKQKDGMKDVTTTLHDLSKLSKDIAKSMDESANIKNKEALAKVYDKVNAAKKAGNALSEYQIDELQMEYELELARLKLEEARNAKSEVRLTRDSEGNFSYVYTANQDEVAKAQQEYEDKLQSAYELNRDYIDKTQELVLQYKREGIEAMNELNEKLNSGLITKSEYEAQATLIETKYKELIGSAQKGIDEALKNQADLYTNYYSILENAPTGDKFADTWKETDLGKILGTQYETVKDFCDKSAEAIGDMVKKSKEELKTLETQNTETMKDEGNFSDYTSNKKAQEIVNNAQTVAKAAVTAAETGAKSIETLGTSVTDWAKTAEESFGKVDKMANQVGESLLELRKSLSNDKDGDMWKIAGGGNDTTAAKYFALKYQNDKDGLYKDKDKYNAELILADLRTRGILNTKEGAENDYAFMVLKQLGINISDLKKLGFSTGGYTGEWSDGSGKLAMLHSKELVLNESDTGNILKVVSTVQEIAKIIDLNALSSQTSGLDSKNYAKSLQEEKQVLEQYVTITLDAPNLTDKNSILEAFDNVINLASQYAYKK